MRTLYAIAFAFLLASSLTAQLEQSMYSPGGGFEISNQWQERQEPVFGLPARGFSLHLDPSYSLFLTEHWMLSASLGGSVYSSDDLSVDNSFIQAGIRYFINPEAERIHFFAGLAPGIDLGDLEASRFNLNLGANQFIGSELALEGSLNYSIARGSDLLQLGLFVRPFLTKSTREQDDNGKVFQRGSLLLSQSVASASYFQDLISLNISPGIGLFLHDRFLIGVQLIAGTSFRTRVRSDFNTSTLSVRPYLRRYLTRGEWNWFAEAGLRYQHTQSKIAESFDFTGSSSFTDLTLGASIFLGESVAIEPFLRGTYLLGGAASMDHQFSTPVIQDVEFKAGPFALTLGARLTLFRGR